MSGLRDELKLRVKAYEPTTLASAYRQARLHELSLEIEHKKQKQTFKTNFNPTPKPNHPVTHQITRPSNPLI